MGPEARHVRVGGRSAQLHHGARLRGRAGAVRVDLAGGRPYGRQGHHAIPRGDLAGHADRGRRGATTVSLRARIPVVPGPADVEIARNRDRSERGPGPVRGGRVPLVPPAGSPIRAGWRLHLGLHPEPVQRRAGQWPGEPREPGAGDGGLLLRGGGPQTVLARRDRPARRLGNRPGEAVR